MAGIPKRTLRLSKLRDQYRNNNTKCTEAVTNEFCRLVRMGLPYDKCCDRLGIARVNANKWLRWGEDYLLASDDEVEALTERNKIRGENYARFFIEVKKAGAEFQIETLENDIDGGDWRKGITMLERRDPSNWAAVRNRYEMRPGSEDGVFTPDNSFL